MATVTRERDELRNAAIALRAAQRSYMAVRSTPGEQREQAGKAVEAAAHRLDAALASPPASDGAALIAAERERQTTSEGWTTEHDDTHVQGELAVAAAGYATAWSRDALQPVRWPFEASAWKPSDDRVKNLVRAGALIAAEIDRVRRAAALASAPADGEARFTQAQVDEAVKPLFAEIDRLKSAIGRAAYRAAEDESAFKALRVAVMVAVSDPDAEWSKVRPRLAEALNASFKGAQAPPASDPPGLVASLREQVRQWRDRASGIDDDNSYHFNSERHARANQMDECADEIEELLPASPQAKED